MFVFSSFLYLFANVFVGKLVDIAENVGTVNTREAAFGLFGLYAPALKTANANGKTAIAATIPFLLCLLCSCGIVQIQCAMAVLEGL